MSIAQNFPALKPSLNLDFANVKKLDPRISFSRASGATYYDGKTVAKAEENLLLRSQEFDNASWSKSRVVVTANTTVAPDGTTTADTIAENNVAGNTTVQQSITTTANGSYTFSCFLKDIDRQYVQISLWRDNSNYLSAAFDLTAETSTTAVAGSGYLIDSASIVDVGNGWLRCSVTGTVGTNTAIWANISPRPDATAGGVPNYSGTTLSFAAWGAQLEQRSAVAAYTPTTDQPITNYIPVLQTASANVARFDHDPVTGESLGLLVEEQRTNLVTYSEQFDNAAWTKINSTIESNVAVAPDGTLTADKWIANSGQTNIQLQYNNLSNTGALNTSVYVKKDIARYFVIANRNFLYGGRIWFDLDNGTIAAQTQGTGSIKNVGNGWFRLSFAFDNFSVSFTQDLVFYLTSTFVDIFTTPSYTGDGYSGIYIWGAQLEAGAFPTSYIKTEASQVTRSADSASMTGANFSEWYRADEGTFVFTNQRPLNVTGVLQIDNGTDSNRLIITGNNNNFDLGYVIVNSSTQAAMEATTTNTGTVDIKALAYKTNDFAYAKNGLTPITDTSGTLPVVNRLLIPNTGAQQFIRKIAYYPQRLNNEQLQALTS